MTFKNEHYLTADSPRQDFSLPFGSLPEMNKARREYVATCFLSWGFDSSSLSELQVTKVFTLLARVEEYWTHLRYNNHNWEPEYSSWERLQYLTTPLIEHWTRQWLRDGVLRPLKDAPPRWPEGKNFALCLTHDVDSISSEIFWPHVRSLRSYRKAPLHQQAIVALSTLKALACKASGRACKSEIAWHEWLEIENRFGYKSTFSFLPQPLPVSHWEDSFYRYSDRVVFNNRRIPLAQVMQELVNGGWDVGLHGSTCSFASEALLRQEREIVSETCGQEVITIRQHHLMFDIRYTPYFQVKAGFKADSTLGSNNHVFFRAGTGLPFYFYDIISDEALDLLEVPLIIQDVVLWNVMQMDLETACRRCIEVMRMVADSGGVLTLLWHNSYSQTTPEFTAYRLVLVSCFRNTFTKSLEFFEY